MFVLPFSSRRETGRRLSIMSVSLKNLRLLFPELETLPHHDTLHQLLCRIEAEEIADALVGKEIRRLISNRKFRNHLVEQYYLIAIDWKIKNNILKKKHHGYQYEHCFSSEIHFLRETLTGPWLDSERIRQLLTRTHQLRLE
jgi:hypothetical protein